MQVIRKYPIQVFGFDYGEVDVPQGEVLKVDFQHGIVNLWVMLEEDEVAQMRIRIVPTGKPFDSENLHHVGSAISATFCWHIFKVY